MSGSTKLERGMMWAPGDTPIVASFSSLSTARWIVKVLGYGALSLHDVGLQNSLQYLI